MFHVNLPGCIMFLYEVCVLGEEELPLMPGGAGVLRNAGSYFAYMMIHCRPATTRSGRTIGEFTPCLRIYVRGYHI